MIRVVITEDDPMVASINQKYVEKASDMKVTAIFLNGKEALGWLENNEADLMIMDLYMPGMDGLELLKEIRRREISLDVIMVTAANDMDSIQTALNYGIVDYLIKPFTYERFAEALERFRRRHSFAKDKERNLNQEQVDHLIAVRESKGKTAQEYPKGINGETLKKLLGYLKEASPSSMDSDELSHASGLSKVTVRRYMNYMIEHNLVSGTVDYRTGGRPSMHYKAL
jgi:response regulator of citrate/malate metabolism